MWSNSDQHYKKRAYYRRPIIDGPEANDNLSIMGHKKKGKKNCHFSNSLAVGNMGRWLGTNSLTVGSVTDGLAVAKEMQNGKKKKKI